MADKKQPSLTEDCFLINSFHDVIGNLLAADVPDQNYIIQPVFITYGMAGHPICPCPSRTAQ